MISLSLVALPLVVSYLVYIYLVFPVFFSPLSKIPSAHFLSSFSPVWILWKRYKGQENRAIHAAHVKYGGIVRLGPNEVSVACVDNGIRTVYSGGFEKWNWYPNQFENYGVPNMFSMANSKPHSIQKRMISNVYSKSYLQSSPELHQISKIMIFDRLLPLLQDVATKGQSLDVHDLNHSSTMDFIIAFIFGLQTSTNFIQDVKTRKEWISIYQSRRPFRFWAAELPGVVCFFKRLGINIIPAWVSNANRWLEDWTLEKCDAAAASVYEFEDPFSAGKEKLDTLPTTPTRTTPIVFCQLADCLKPNPAYRSPHPMRLSIATELHDHLAAGHETSGITLTYLFHELSLNPPIQSRLRAELRAHLPSLLPSSPERKPHDMPNPRTIDALPFLNACLLETLRIHAAIPGPQPRITPHSPSMSLANSPPLPGGVRVSAQAYTLHRNADVFPEPELWRPERWIEASEAEKLEMGRWFWAFGSGGRMCIGRHFAVQEMKLITAAIYANFTTHIVDDEGIEQIDAYTAGPKGNKLMLRFERVE
ncbi:hypothetical protein N7G274_006272 [Stereocaulon virgatum]|uniref:Cytochrome P450 n=1 Tax=Stereocaulon virgatum TaxID=373712 RepID=A0ABR4A4H7_9LECA